MPHASPAPSSFRTDVLTDLALGVAPALLVAGATGWALGLSPMFPISVLTLYALFAGLVFYLLPEQPWFGIGAANRVTVVRATLVLALAALAPHSTIHTAPGQWWIVGVATVALGLDSLDGLVARRTGTSTPFGARFDMELDSFLMVVLTILVWQSGQVGSWILLLGLPRYVFISAGWLWPWLEAPLPQRIRRKTGCVAQGIALVLCLSPVVPTLAASVGALATLLLLIGSFGVDVVWLFRRRTLSRTDGAVG